MNLNNKDNIKEMDIIQVIDSMKYFGVILHNKKKCFISQINRLLDNGSSFSNQIFAVLGNSCNRRLNAHE